MKNLKPFPLLLLIFSLGCQNNSNIEKQTAIKKETKMEKTKFKSLDVGGISIAYREAGNPENPTLVLLHG